MREIFVPFMSLHGVRQLIILCGVHLLFALPFSTMVFIPGLTNLRPVTALIPIFGIFFGPAGAWGYAFGNIAYDVISGNLAISCIGGFLGNFFATLLFWLLVKKITSDGRVVGTLSTCLAYIALSVGASVTVGLSVAFWIFFFIPDVGAINLFLSIVINNTFFCIMPGMALCILLSTEFNLTPYRGDRASPSASDDQEELSVQWG